MATSLDGRTWGLVNSGTSNGLIDVQYGDGVFVAVGGTVIISTNGQNWVARNPGTASDLYSVTYGRGGFIAVGDTGTVISSRDGSIWSRRNFNSPITYQWLFGVCHGDRGFVAVGERSTRIISTDGVAWTSTTGLTVEDLESIAFGAGRFVAVGRSYSGSQGTALWSQDGIEWALVGSGLTAWPYAVAFGDEQFVAVGANDSIFTSRDGFSWQNRYYRAQGILTSVAYGKGTFVAVGYPAAILTSPDGIGWTRQIAPTTNTLGGVVFGNDMFVALAAGNAVLTSPDAVSWTIHTNNLPLGLRTPIIHGKGVFVAATPSGVATSSDGVTWVERQLPTTNGIVGLCFGNDLFLAAEWWGPLFVSTNAVQWDASTRTIDAGLIDFAYGRGTFVGVGYDGAILQTRDERTNSPKLAPRLAPIQDVVVNENETLAFTIRVDDPDLPADAIYFGLDPDSPSGARLHPLTGAFSWTPSESQGPSTNQITVRVWDDSFPARTDSLTFQVTVRELNAPSILVPPVDQVVLSGIPATIRLNATDPDIPYNVLQFELLASPVGARIDAVTGEIHWTPPAGSAGKTNSFTVRVTDDGVPPLSATASFDVGVLESSIWPGFPRGPALAVSVTSNYAFVASGVGGLAIFDVTDPGNLFRVSFFETRGDAQDVKVVGGYAYVAENGYDELGLYPFGELEIIDVKDPLHPKPVGAVSTATDLNDENPGAFRLQVEGNLAYVADGDAGLTVIDLTNPANPRRLANYVTTATAYGIALSGNRAYVAEVVYTNFFEPVGGRLEIVDISNVQSLQQVGILDIGAPAWAVTVVGTNAYLAADNVGLVIVDVSEPSQPAKLGGFASAGVASDLVVRDGYAYVVDGGAGLQIVDVSSPINPRLVAGYDTDGFASSLAVQGDYAYVADGSDGLQVINIHNPQNLQRTGGVFNSGWAHDIQIANGFLYLADGQAGLRIFDLITPLNPIYLGGYNTPDTAWGVYAASNFVYLANFEAGLLVFDVADKSIPKLVGSFDTSGIARKVQVKDGYAYLADSASGLQIIDVNNPANPVWVGGLTNIGTTRMVQVVGNHAYAATSRGLQIFDISNPSGPVHVGGSLTNRYVQSVHVVGSLAYVASISSGLHIVDISKPGAPRLVRTFLDSELVYDVRLCGPYAYVAKGLAGVEIFNVADPSNPVRVHRFDTPGSAEAIDVAGDIIYVADSEWGLLAVRSPAPIPMTIKPPVLAGTMINLAWQGAPTVRLQRTTSLLDANWSDVVGTEGQSNVTLLITEQTAFFRLIRDGDLLSQ